MQFLLVIFTTQERKRLAIAKFMYPAIQLNLAQYAGRYSSRQCTFIQGNAEVTRSEETRLYISWSILQFEGNLWIKSNLVLKRSAWTTISIWYSFDVNRIPSEQYFQQRFDDFRAILEQKSKWMGAIIHHNSLKKLNRNEKEVFDCFDLKLGDLFCLIIFVRWSLDARHYSITWALPWKKALTR